MLSVLHYEFICCGPKGVEVTGERRQLHNEELHNLYSLPDIIRMIKSRRMRWEEHVARIGEKGMHIGYWLESQKERNHKEDQDVGGWTMLKWILDRQDRMVWTGSSWLRIGTSGGLL
jgi:hypothetical protein